MQLDIQLTDEGLRQLSVQQVQNIIESMDASQYLTNQAYYEGDNEAIIKYSDSKQNDPNNLIPLPFARRTVNDVVGYSGKPGLIEYELDSDQNLDKYNEIVKKSNLWLNTSEVFQDTLVKGEGSELAWTDSEGMLRFTKIPREQVQFFYDNTVEENLMFSVRSYKQRQVKIDGTPYFKFYCEVYFDDHIDYYEGIAANSSEYRYDPQEGMNQYATVIGASYYKSVDWTYTGTEESLLGYVALYPYHVNSDKKGIFQPSIPIIDRLDMFGSDSIANAIDRFNDSILTLSKELSEKDAEKIKEWRIIDGLGTEGDFVKFITREMDLESSVEGFKLFERLYYELTSVPNMNDEKFNQKSGIAIAYALVPFENLVAQIETYFNKGLEYRMKIINFYLGLTGQSELTYQIKWHRNLPFDLVQRVDVVTKIKEAGLLSDETLIKMFPGDIVQDAEEELQRKKDQDEENFQNFQNRMIQEPQDNEEDED
jgi:SPP1 family phage portal protein